MSPRAGTPSRLSPNARPNPSPRIELSRESVLATAVRILDAEGLDAVTMRRVAQVMDTGAASLYAHVKNKNDLLDLLYDHVLDDVEVPEPRAERWSQDLRALLTRIREAFLTHRDLARISAERVPEGENVLRLQEGCRRLVAVSGVPEDRVLYVTHLLMGYTVGVIRAETRNTFLGDVGALAEISADERFDTGLDLLLQGVAGYSSEARSST